MQKNSNNHKIFLVGLSAEFNKAEILSHFAYMYKSSKFNLEMSSKKNGRNQGWAVLSVNKKATKDKILSKHSFHLNERKFFAKIYLKGKKLKNYKKELKRRRLFLKGLPENITKQELYDFFSRFGAVEDTYTIKKYENDLSSICWDSGFGFVVFKKLKDAEKLLKLGKVKFDENDILIEEYQTKDEKIKRWKKKRTPGSFDDEESYYEKKYPSKQDFLKKSNSSEVVGNIPREQKQAENKVEIKNKGADVQKSKTTKSKKKTRFEGNFNLRTQKKNNSPSQRNLRDVREASSRDILQLERGIDSNQDGENKKQRTIPGFSFKTNDGKVISKIQKKSLCLIHSEDNLRFGQGTHIDIVFTSKKSRFPRVKYGGYGDQE